MSEHDPAIPDTSPPESVASDAPSNASENTAPRNTYVSVPDDVLLQHVSDETVLLHLTTGTYFGLDPIGTRMLDLAIELSDEEAVVEALESEYEAERDTLAHDLEHLLSDLAGKSLIVRSATD